MKYPERMHQHADAIDALRASARIRALVMDQIAKEVEEQEGIPFDWFEVLARIAEEPDERIKMADLANWTLHSKSGMTRLFDRIEKAGLACRTTSEEDRRIVFATLTDRGHALLERIMEPVTDIVIERFASHITREEGAFITQTLNRVLAANDVESHPSTESRINPHSAPTGARP